MSNRAESAVTFNRRQAEYLIAHLKLSADAIASLRSASRSVELSGGERKDLLDQVANRLQEAGFGADYEPTHEGHILESLIDVLKT